MKDALEQARVPDAEAARERAWRVVQAGFEAHEPVTPSPRRWPLVAAVAGAALAAGLVSPPGRAVLDQLREAVGVERAQPALFRLPSPGRLLVASSAGVWVVEPDGSKRLLAGYREASWSPLGRFVVAAKRNELAATRAGR